MRGGSACRPGKAAIDKTVEVDWLDQDMTGRDMAEVLRQLKITAGFGVVRVDSGARDYLVAAIIARCSGKA